MTKITVSADCGNAPKKGFLKEINIAFAKGNLDFLTESVTDKIVWNIIGNKKIEGKLISKCGLRNSHKEIVLSL